MGVLSVEMQTQAMEVDKEARRVTPGTPMVQWWVLKEEPEMKTKKEKLRSSRAIHN